MKILICNDDGIESNGLKCLAEKLAENNEILVVAPKENRSACSHTLTIHDSVSVTKYDRIKGCKAYFINGSPVDCVKIALHVFGDFKPDLVISGINKGHNLGSDILYSGTVAITYEAAFFGLPAFAFSAFSHGESDFSLYSDKCVEILNKLLPYTKSCSIWNINFPDTDLKIKGVKYTPLAKSVYLDRYDKQPDGSYKLVGIIEDDLPFSDCDAYWNRNGYITITPLLYDKTDFITLRTIREK